MPNTSEKIVHETLQNLLQELGSMVAVTNSTVIYGLNGCLNSLALVRLIVDLEEQILMQYHLKIVIANERSLSQKNSPFLTVSTLTDYINTLLNPHE